VKAVSWRPSLTSVANRRANSTGAFAPATQTGEDALCDGPGEVTRVNFAVVRFLSPCETQTVDLLGCPRFLRTLGVLKQNLQAILRDSPVAPSMARN